jgi:hypothetical protein
LVVGDRAALETAGDGFHFSGAVADHSAPDQPRVEQPTLLHPNNSYYGDSQARGGVLASHQDFTRNSSGSGIVAVIFGHISQLYRFV